MDGAIQDVVSEGTVWMVLYVLGEAFHQDVQVNLLAESVQIDFFKSTDRFTENADVIWQEAFDVVKSLVCWESVGRATANLRGPSKAFGSAGESTTI